MNPMSDFKRSGRVGVAPIAAIFVILFVVGGMAWFSCNKESATTPSAGAGSGAETKPTAAEINKSLPPIDPATVGTIKGIVRFDGKPPAREVFTVTPECATNGHAAIEKEELVVGGGGGLANVFIYIHDDFGGRAFDPPAAPVVLDQSGCTYRPHVIAVQTGQQLLIRNSDNISHNVNASPLKSAGFNQGMPSGTPDLKLRFKILELKKLVKCDIHPWMSAWIYAVNHPYFAVTKDNGSFEIAGVPPGKYKIDAIHETLGIKSLDVELGKSDTKTIEFHFGK